MTITREPCGSGGTASTQAYCMVDSSTGVSEEIISMGQGPYGPIYYTKSQIGAGAGQAWVQRGYTRNAQGDFYSTGGVSKQINNPQPYAGTPVTSADPQDFQYLTDSAPGAGAWRMYWERIAPWWENVFGVRQSPAPSSLNAEGNDAPNMNPILIIVGGIMIYSIMRRK